MEEKFNIYNATKVLRIWAEPSLSAAGPPRLPALTLNAALSRAWSAQMRVWDWVENSEAHALTLKLRWY